MNRLTLFFGVISICGLTALGQERQDVVTHHHELLRWQRADEAGRRQQRAAFANYYDTFNQKWLDPAKWLATGPFCWGGLECVREIQNGQLRLAVRNFGATDSDSGLPVSESEVDFVNPNAINSITADVALSSFSGVGCSTNNNDKDWTHMELAIGGYFFNTGTGDPADDVLAMLNI